MNLDEAIEHTKKKPGLKVSHLGLLTRVASHDGNLGAGERYMLKECAQFYEEGRKAWLKGDLETVAEMFGVMV